MVTPKMNRAADADQVELEDPPQGKICMDDHRAMVKKVERSMCFYVSWLYHHFKGRNHCDCACWKLSWQLAPCAYVTDSC